MAHEYAKLREMHPGQKRAHTMSKGYKTGGKVHSDEAADKKLITKMLNKHEAGEKPEGKKAGGRLDKFARGGKTKSKGKGNHVNIAIINPKGGADAAAAPPLGGGMPPPPPRAPMAPPGPMMGGPSGGLPPGMGPKPPGMMKRGGKVKMTAGADSGVGRKQKVAAYGKNARSKN